MNKQNLNPSKFGWIFFYAILFIIGCNSAKSQCIKANFGVDGDVYSDSCQFNKLNGRLTDDWFKYFVGNGIGIIDTSGSYKLNKLLSVKNTSNFTFSKNLAFNYYSVVGGNLIMSARYARDNFSQGTYKDSTAFLTSNKNGDNPSNWKLGVSSVNGKDDIIDALTQLRRSGTTTSGHLLYYAAISTGTSTGNHYVDIEGFGDKLQLNGSSLSTTANTTTGGHKPWKFNSAGKVIQTGDMVVSIYFSNKGVNSYAVYLWVSDTTYNTSKPLNFNWGDTFNVGSSPKYGYAIINLPTGSFCGAVNTGNTKTPPWGSNSGGSYITSYSPGQYVEWSIDLTQLGLDPAIIDGGIYDACHPLFQSVIWKSRTSASFRSNLVDFVGPQNFDPSVQTSSLTNIYTNVSVDTLTSTHNISTLFVIKPTIYNNMSISWSTPNGSIISGSNGDTIIINKPGAYIASGYYSKYCSSTKISDTVFIYRKIEMNLGEVISIGLSPLSGHSYSWTSTQGPIVSTTSMMSVSPVINTIYTIKDNFGGKIYPIKFIVIVKSAPLPVQLVDFSVKIENSNPVLNWTTLSEENNWYFEIERSDDCSYFYKIGQVMGNGTKKTETHYEYIDNNTGLYFENLYYRLKQFDYNGKFEYSDVRKVSNIIKNNLEVYYNQGVIVIITFKSTSFTLSDITGRILKKIDVGANNEIKIDINYLNNGIYILSSGDGDKYYFMKF